MDCIVAKFSVEGTLLWATYLGGGDDDRSYGIATDKEGNAYVAGSVFSSDFPTLNAYDSTFNGNTDAIVVKLSGDGSVMWSTFLGGGLADTARSIAVDGNGNVYWAGSTTSSNFPVPNGWDTTINGGMDAVIVKFAQYNIPERSLNVTSSPPPHVSITGTLTGSTPLVSTLDDKTAVALTACATAASGSTDYDFSRWVIDGDPKIKGQLTASFNLEANTSAVALYAPAPRNLSVQSEPPTGVAITGSPAGITDYVAQRGDNTSVTLKATASAAGGYAFVNWRLNGSSKPYGKTTLSFTIKNHSTATARYKLYRYLKLTGPTTVNESSSARYICKLYCRDGTAYTITPYAKWTENSAYAKFSSAGLLKTYSVPASKRVRLSATYAGRTCYLYVTIRNVR
jgi:hypothetical protein